MTNLIEEYEDFLTAYFDNKKLEHTDDTHEGKKRKLEAFLVITADYEFLAMQKATELLDRNIAEDQKRELRRAMMNMCHDRLRMFIEQRFMQVTS
jgi:hypothetical protein